MLSSLFQTKGTSPPPPPSYPDPPCHMPSEEDTHAATWLAWPHEGISRRRQRRYEPSWIAMCTAITCAETNERPRERVYIIVPNEKEQNRVSSLLRNDGCELSWVSFVLWETDDIWMRDTAGVFVRREGELVLENWGFNGWGAKTPFRKDNQIPLKMAQALGMTAVNIPLVNEGGSIELDGHGTLMAKESSILNRNRNPDWSKSDVEKCFRHYLGVTNFIWLKGHKGGDITDDHIDGTARFACDGRVIVTFAREDFEYPNEYDSLAQATNAYGQHYRMVHLPLTKRKVVKRDYGFYVNYYVANHVVLMPSFDDPNDDVAKEILQDLYSDRKVVQIPMTEVLKDGGMVHCVTQQQPLAIA